MPTLDLSNRLNPGTLVGRFIIHEWMAAGGTADVYSCYADTDEPSAGQRYVAKVFRFYGEETDYLRKRKLFEREAEVLEAISGNIHVVTVAQKGAYFDGLNRKHPRPFAILQRLTGGSLADLICEQKFDEMTAARVAIGLLDALIYAHSRGFLHCDVKPDNVMLDESRNPVWIDFGISKEIDMPNDVVSIMSERGAVAVGTAPYMSPEHFLGRASLCPQSDVWSMGVLLMRMLTWVYPFGLHFEQVRQRIKVQTWQEFHGLPVFKGTETSPSVSPEMQAIIVKCLQVDLDNRYASAEALRADLEAFVSRRPLPHATGTGEDRSRTDTGTDLFPIEPAKNRIANDHGMSKRAAFLGGTAAALVIVLLVLLIASVIQRIDVTGSTLGDGEIAAGDADADDRLPEPPARLSPRTPQTEAVPPDIADEDDGPNEVAEAPPVEDEPLPQIEGVGAPVSVMLYPNRGYRGERVVVNGERVATSAGLVRRFESRTGDVFEWEIMGTDGRMYRHRVRIPPEAGRSQQVRINWQTGAIDGVSQDAGT